MKTYLQFINESLIEGFNHVNNLLDLYVLYIKLMKNPYNVITIYKDEFICDLFNSYCKYIDNEKEGMIMCKDEDTIITNYGSYDDYLYLMKLNKNKDGTYKQDEFFSGGDGVFDKCSEILFLNKILENIDEYIETLFKEGRIDDLIYIHENGGILPQHILNQLKDVIKQSEWS